MVAPIDPVSLDTTEFLQLSSEHSPAADALWEGVERWQRLIERKLEAAPSGEQSNTWNTLEAAGDALEAHHERSREYLERLLMPGAEAASRAAPDTYRLLQLTGALAEAELQTLLGTLSPNEQAAIAQALNPMLDGREPPHAYLLGTLELSDGEQTAHWPGAFTLTTLTALTDFTEPPRVLLYRFGVQGGWSAHDTSEGLLNELSTALAALPPHRVIMTAASPTAVSDTLAAQLAALQTLRQGWNDQASESAERGMAEALDTLSTPLNPARALAFTRMKEIRRSLQLGEAAQAWLGRTPANVRAELARLVAEYASAITASELLLRRDLPTRDSYVTQRVNERLATEFGLTAPCRVRLKLPVSVNIVTDIIEGSGAPGTPVRQVPRPSQDTERVPLERLALEQIDDAMAQRLPFMDVEVYPRHHPQAAAIKQGITPAWLKQVVPDLDVAGGYERLLVDAHVRAGQFHEQATELAVLYRPYALMLEIHTLIAQQRSRLDARGHLMVQTALSATSEQDWASAGLDLVIRPVALTLFDERSQSRGATLAGVVLIQDRTTDATVLFLPQAPNGEGLRQFASLDAAVEALQDRFIDQGMRRHLCARALEGDPRQLESLVNQALIRGFRQIVEARAAWPSEQSLTANQYLADMGLAIAAHRRTSRSTADSLFEDTLASRDRAVRYIHMALGFVPFLGSLVALADAIEAGITAGRAFAGGDSVRGLEAIQSVLLSLTDALFDFTPAGFGVSAGTASLAATAKARQLRQGLADASRLRRLSSWSARREGDAFNGYEQLATLTTRAGTEGQWRGVHREPAGNFITRAGAIYAVEWDATYGTWRLAGTRIRSYRQPVALDENGQWQTHGQLYGSLVDGGLAGGGGMQSYLADRLDPLWPDALRRLLPRWWTDAQFRRQQRLLSQRDAQLHAAFTSEAHSARILEESRAGRATSQDVVDTAQQSIRACSQLYATLEELSALTLGRRTAEAAADQSACAATICDQLRLQIEIASVEEARLVRLARAQRAEIDRIMVTLMEAPPEQVPDINAFDERVRFIRNILGDMLVQYERIGENLQIINQWQGRVTVARHRSALHPKIEAVMRKFRAKDAAMMRVHLLLDLAPQDDLSLASWGYMRAGYGPARERLERAMITKVRSPELSLTPDQQRRVQRQLRENAQAMIRTVRRLTLRYPEQFDLRRAERLLEELQQLHDAAPSTPVAEARAPREQRPRMFESDGMLLIGEPMRRDRNVVVIDRFNQGQEQWRRNANREWTLENAPAPQAAHSPGTMARHARERLRDLPALRARLRQYEQGNPVIADMEDLYLGESQELQERAQQLRRADTDHRHSAIIQSLQEEADALRIEARQVRVRLTKASQTPTGAHLEYLMGAGEIFIRKLGDLQLSGTTPRTRNWLQEFEVIDRVSGKPLCYAHFHYSQAEPRFADFKAAHLKTPTQRYLAVASPGQPPIWRGEITRQLATQLFEPLFH